MDVKKEIRRAVDTGKVLFGLENAQKNILKGNGKIVILSSSIKKEEEEKIKYLAGLGGIKLLEVDESSVKLGEICGKPFKISAMTVLDAGKSSILT